MSYATPPIIVVSTKGTNMPESMIGEQIKYSYRDRNYYVYWEEEIDGVEIRQGMRLSYSEVEKMKCFEFREEAVGREEEIRVLREYTRGLDKKYGEDYSYTTIDENKIETVDKDMDNYNLARRVKEVLIKCLPDDSISVRQAKNSSNGLDIGTVNTMDTEIYLAMYLMGVEKRVNRINGSYRSEILYRAQGFTTKWDYY